MIYIAYFDTTGRITSTEKAARAVFGDNTWFVEINADELLTVAQTHHVDVSTKTLKNGAIANPNPMTMPDVISKRDFMLVQYGHILTEFMLPDSFPKMSASGRQAKIDVVIAYRQALRDITKQTDPANITWPTPPA